MKRRILSIFLTLCMVLCLVPNVAFANVDTDISGSGTEGDPYRIYTAEGLKQYSNNVGRTSNDEIYAELMNDIVLNDGSFDENGNYTKGKSKKDAEIWEPISETSPSYYISFNGNGYTIKGMYVKDRRYAGLFGVIGCNIVIKNVTVTGCVSVTDSFINIAAGGIVGMFQGENISITVSNCINKANVLVKDGKNGTEASAAGIIGRILPLDTIVAEITECSNEAAITVSGSPSAASVGGIIGSTAHRGCTVKLSSSFNSGKITSNIIGDKISYFGGLVGEFLNLNSDSYITDCGNVGEIGGTNIRCAGGIVATTENAALSNLYNAGKISADNFCAIAEAAHNTSYTNCYYLEGTAEYAVAGYGDRAGLRSYSEFSNGTVLELLKNNRTDSPWAKQGYSASVSMWVPMFNRQKSDYKAYNISIVDANGYELPITTLNCNDVLGNGKVSFFYDELNEKGTLTLDGAELISEYDTPIAAYDMENLEIVLNGKNKIGTEGACITAKNLIFSGEGSLEITTPLFYAIDSIGSVTVNGGNIKVDASDSALCFDGKFTVNGGTVELIGAAQTAIVPSFTGNEIILGDDRIMIAGRFYNGSDAQVTDVSNEDAISEAKYIKIFNKYIPVTFNPGQYGTGAASTKNKIYGQDFGLPNALFTRAGYKQVSWTTAEDDSGEILRLGSAYSGNEALTLYPVWQAEQYEITYNLGGGTATGNPNGYTVETDDFTLNNPTRDGGFKFAGWSGTGLTGTDNMTVTVPKGSMGNREYTANWLDISAPVINGLTDGKIYCSAVEFSVTDNDGIGSVTVDGTPITAENGKYKLNPMPGVQLVTVKDLTGNSTEYIVTVNDGHEYAWEVENGQYWQKCVYCGHETAKKAVPVIYITGSDRVCRTQDYDFCFELPDGARDPAYVYDFAGLGESGNQPIFEDNMYLGSVKAAAYPAEENSFKLIINAVTADGYEFSAEKTVTIQDEHSGGNATCVDKAHCDTCGAAYGELMPDNHTDLRHFSAKVATEEFEGNIEYWYCFGCGKYYMNATATKEITKADTVIAKLEKTEPENDPSEEKPSEKKPSEDEPATKNKTSPKTGERGNLSLWLALLFVGGTATAATVAVKRKNRS